MSTHGRGPLGRLWWGNVADRLTRDAPCPILLRRVQEQLPGKAPISEQFEHILVNPVPALAAALPPGLDLPADTGFMTPAEWGGSAAWYTGQDGAAGSIEEQTVTHEVLVRSGSTAAQILEYSTHHDIDLVVLTTRGRVGLARMVMGSVTDKVLRSSLAPVLVIPPAAVRRSRGTGL